MPWFAETEFPRPGPSRRSASPAKSGPYNDHKEAHGNHQCFFAQTVLRFNVKGIKECHPHGSITSPSCQRGEFCRAMMVWDIPSHLRPHWTSLDRGNVYRPAV